ncbi:unnamed protein product [Jaminaea pallidilutea]
MAASSALLVDAQSSAPVGPLSTNNAQSACVQYGDCTALPPSNTYQTASQYGPITPPASSQATAAPTNEAETLASLSDLASEGAASVYATRSNNQQPASSNVGTAPLTGTILASDTTSVATADPTSDPNNAAFQGRSNFLGAAAAAGWVGMPLVAAAFGAAIVAL